MLQCNHGKDDDDVSPDILSTNSIPEMTIDEVLRKTKFGVYQVMIVIASCYLNFSQSYQTLVMYYVGDSPSWKCTTNTTLFCASNLNKTFENTDDDFQRRCKMNSSSWTYTKLSSYSIVTEFDLVCSREYMQALVNAMFFLGWACGGIFTGIIADKFGRKKVLFGCYFTLCLFPILSCYISAIWQLMVLRVIIGIATGTGLSLLYIYHSEFQAPEHRNICLNIQWFFYNGSMFVLTAVAMYVQEWRKLELYAAFPAILSLIITLVLPESPRWLLSSGRTSEAIAVLKNIARKNGHEFSFTLKDDNDCKKKVTKYTYLDLFNNCPVLIFLSVQLLAWFTFGLVYYGLALESSSLGGNIYENFMLTNLADVIGSFISVPLFDWLGRRKSTVFSALFCGIALSGIAGVPKSINHGHIIRLVLALSGKLFISIGFGALYLWSTELFPTVVRSQGITLCQLVSRIGSACSPFLTTVLQDVFTPLPFIVMAFLSLVTSLTILLLPETNRKPTRENYEEIFQKTNVVEDDSILPLLQEESS